MGIGYIAAVLEKSGYEVAIIDKTIACSEVGSLVNEILLQEPDILGFYCFSENFKTVMEILKIVKDKSPSTITAIGGPHVYGLPKQGMAFDCVDFSFWGEAEESFLKLIQNNFNPEMFRYIDGLIYREAGEIKVNTMALIQDLNKLPFPARHLYPPLDMYRPSILAYKRLPATGMLTSRGCAFKCVFCHSGKGDFGLRFHSAEYVLEEMKLLKKGFGINEIVLFDDTFLINEARALSICEGIIRENLDISWSINARVNNINKNILKVLKRAGCWMVQIGVESGNSGVLKTIKKGITLERAEKACELAYDEGFIVKTYFILGHPTETEDTINETIKFMTKLPAHYASINFMTPLPGTQLWDVAEKYGTFDKEKLEKINYLSDDPAFVPFGLTEMFLKDKFREAYLKFYLNPKTIFRHIRAIRGIEDLRKILMGFSILLRIIYSKIFTKGVEKNV
ncbi:MAG: B12-binding domain-containing radical SAM protein [Candidatus Kuenenia stuttgartiensis]|nr:MAG: B12-binding domain-containing radical SAM protein [Candidatus Kuenenia stuttgartiensis]